MKTEILYGFHPIIEALKAKRRTFTEIYLDKNKKSQHIAEITEIAEYRGVLLKIVESSYIKTLVGSSVHQGVAAKVSSYPLVPFEHIFEKSDQKIQPLFLLMLDTVLDPQNLGAIIRTALCVGIDGVIMSKDRSAPPTPAVSKASAGALEHIFLSRVTNLVQTIKHCKNSGLWVMGLQKDAAQSIYAADLSGSIAFVLGGEQKGIRRLVKENCDFLVSIPQQGALDSLNVSVAAAVAMYEAFRQRNNE